MNCPVNILGGGN